MWIQSITLRQAEMKYKLLLFLLVLTGDVSADPKLPLVSIPYDVYYVEPNLSDLEKITAEIEANQAANNVETVEPKQEQKKAESKAPAYVHDEFNKDHPPLPNDAKLENLSVNKELWSFPKKSNETVSQRQAVPSGYVDKRISVYKRIIPDEERRIEEASPESGYKWRNQDYLFQSDITNNPTKIPNANLFLRK